MTKIGNFQFSTKNSWLKSGLVLFGIAIILVVLGNYFIEQKIAETIAKTNQLSYDEIDFNLLFGNLEITNITAAQTLLDTNLVDIKSSQINICGLSYWQYLRHNKIVARSLSFDDLVVNISDKKIDNTRIDGKSNNTLAEYSAVLIRTFQVKNGTININTKQFEKAGLNSFSTEISDLEYFPTADNSNLKWKNIAVHLDDLFLNEKKQNHSISMANIKLNTDKSLEIVDIKIIPKRSKEDFIKPLTYRKDRLDITIPKLRINNFSAREILTNKRFITDYIEIEKPTISVFSNYTKPRCPDCFKTYFYEYLAQTDFQISIDSIAIQDSKINYELLKVMNRETGSLYWTNVNTTIYDLTNIEARNKENTKVKITAQFMEQGDTKVNFTFPNYDRKKAYTFSASLDKLNLDNLNPFLNAYYRLNIEKGEFIQLKLNGSGNLQIASGEMILLYDNLAVKFYKSDNSERGFLTNLANGLLKERNGINNEKPRIAKMYAKRDKNKLFIENWVATLRTGLYSALLPNIMLQKELIPD
jgi:hypothetical protein